MIDSAAGSARLAREKNVARYVGGSHVDTNTGQVNGSAFDRGPKDIDGLSFTQLGVLAVDPVNDAIQIRRVVGSRLALGKSACFAELNVGTSLAALSDFDVAFAFVENPLPAEGSALANPAHALLLGLPFKGEDIASLRSELAGDLLALKIIRTFPARVQSGL